MYGQLWQLLFATKGIMKHGRFLFLPKSNTVNCQSAPHRRRVTVSVVLQRGDRVEAMPPKAGRERW